MCGGLPEGTGGFSQGGGVVVTVHGSDEGGGDVGWADGFTFVVVGAVAEAFGVHLPDHAQDAAMFFGFALGEEVEVIDFSADEEHG